jgi:hypothetical protein
MSAAGIPLGSVAGDLPTEKSDISVRAGEVTTVTPGEVRAQGEVTSVCTGEVIPANPLNFVTGEVTLRVGQSKFQ